MLKELILRIYLKPFVEDRIVGAIHGYRQKRGTLSALLEALFFIRDASTFAIVKIDLKDAFNEIKHDVILAQLESLDIPGELKSTASIILKSRIYKYVADGQCMYWSPKKGIPQGGLISPILFLVGTQGLHLLNNDWRRIYRTQMMSCLCWQRRMILIWPKKFYLH